MNIFDKTITHLYSDFNKNPLLEMAVKEISNKDFLSDIKKHDYQKALETYLKLGGAIGGRAQPRRTLTAWRGYIAKNDPRYEGVSEKDIDEFEKVLMKAHADKKEEEKSGKAIKELEPKETKPSIQDTIKANAGLAKAYDELHPETKITTFKKPEEYAKIDKEKAEKLGKEKEKPEEFASAVREAQEMIKGDKKFATYISSFPRNVRDKFLPEIIQDYKDGYEIPDEFRNDEDWIETSFKVHNPFGTKKEKQLHRVSQMKATKEAREKIKRKELKARSSEEPEGKVSGIKPKKLTGDEAEEAELEQASKELEKEKLGHVSATHKGKESMFDKYGYSKEAKEASSVDKEIKELVKKASLEMPQLNDSDVVRKQKERSIIDIAQNILALKKIHIFKTEEGVKAKMPDPNDELYPLAQALLKYKKTGEQDDFRKLILGIKRIGTHAPEQVKAKAVKRLEDELGVGLTELNALVKEDNIDKLKAIAKEVVGLYDYTKARKPALSEFRKRFGDDSNTFEAYQNINYLYNVVYGVIKDATAKDIRDKLAYFKKQGLSNILDIKAVTAGPSAKAKENWEKENEALESRLER